MRKNQGIKKFLATLLAAVLLISAIPMGAFTFTASAETTATSGTTGDCTWSLNGTVLTISGNGEMRDSFYWGSSPWGKNVTKVIIERGVTNIGDYAFFRFEELSSVELPDTLTKIGHYAFYACPALTEINIPNSVTEIGAEVFNYCSSLKKITISNNLDSIGYKTFHNTAFYADDKNWENDVLYIGNNLIQAKSTLSGTYTIKDGTKTIVEYAFSQIWEGESYLQNLKEVIIPDTVTTIGRGAFSGCSSLSKISLPNGVKSVEKGLFSGCTSLTQVSLPNNITSIGDMAFYDCSNLKSINIPDSVKIIEAYAFMGCESLETIVLSNKITSIGFSAFSGCNALTSITIPDSVTVIGDISLGNDVGGLVGCNGLKNITVSTKNENYSSIDGVLFNKDKTELLVYPAGKTETEYTIPDSVTSVNCLLGYCTNLISINVSSGNNYYSSLNGVLFNKDKTEIIEYPRNKTEKEYIIPNGVTSIGSRAFRECANLTSITIPDSVTSIGEWSFYRCTGLTSVTIPDSVTNIDMFAFYECANLTDVYYSGSESDKNEITINSTNDNLLNATWHYNLTDAEWKQDSTGWWYDYGNGDYAKGWENIGGTWYYFNQNGYMLANTWIDGYYLTSSGAMTTPTWQQDANGWWYSYGDGTYAIGWTVIDGAWYYFNEGGYMVTGWLDLGGTWYYMSGSGAMVTSWTVIGGSWYYFYADGSMAANAWIGNYYLTASGTMATPSWQLDGNGWWYSYGDGTYATGWAVINGSWYYFNASGYMVTGWLNLGGTWYYMNGSGAMVTDWQLIGGSWYYFYADGSMAANCYVGNYWLSPSGAMA